MLDFEEDTTVDPSDSPEAMESGTSPHNPQGQKNIKW